MTTKTLLQAQMTAEELIEATEYGNFHINGFTYYSDTTKFVTDNYLEVVLFFHTIENAHGIDLSRWKSIPSDCKNITRHFDDVSRVVLELVVDQLKEDF